MIIHENVFNEVLLAPITKGADGLNIISGYASSAMAFHHLEQIKEKRSTLN